jgi:hypothetical protein
MATAVTAPGLMVGGLAGGFLIAHAATSTGTSSSPSTSTPSSSSPSTGTTATTPPAGTFHPNEDPTHESGESAAREAQENAGQRPTVP